jgi:hypothetical protein
MTSPVWRSGLAGLAPFAVPGMASAQTANCPPSVSSHADTAGRIAEAEQMRCDPDDPVNRLNKFMIGTANLSPGRTCSAS